MWLSQEHVDVQSLKFPYFEFMLQGICCDTMGVLHARVFWSYYSHEELRSSHLNVLLVNSNLSQFCKEIGKHSTDWIPPKSISQFDSKMQKKKMSRLPGELNTEFSVRKRRCCGLSVTHLLFLTQVVRGPTMPTHFLHLVDYPLSGEPDSR